jgi:hypothetical protein
MAFFPQGQLYVAGTELSAIWALNVDQITGQLTQAGSPLTVSSAPLQLAFLGLVPSID